MHPRTPHPTPPPSPEREYDLDHGIIYTEIKPLAARLMTLVFVVLIFSVPVGQLIWELTQHKLPVVFQVFQTIPTRSSLRKYEENLESASHTRQRIQQWLQLNASSKLGYGNSKVVIGRDGWLFYRPGVDYLTGPGFLTKEQLHDRHKKMVDEGDVHFRPDPRPAILQFNEQCRQHGVRLVLLPIPDKAQLQPAQLSRGAEFSSPIPPPSNPDYQQFIAEMRQQGVEVIDVLPQQLKPEDRRFLVQDTHWTPQWMEEVAQQVAEHLKPQLPATTTPAVLKQQEQVTRLGDLVDTLKLPENQTLFVPQTVTVERILNAQSKLSWHADTNADVLVLGDSFSNIFSFDQMGWGESAGFVEHLSYHLGRPIDRLVRNDAGAHATRDMLAKEYQRGNDRLAGKKIVIWEFAARELACGDWKLLPIKLGEKREVGMYTPSAGRTISIRGVVRAASPAPRPGTVPYKDHILMLHLADIESTDDPSAKGKEAVVFAWSMRDNKAMPAAHYRIGDVVQLRVQLWADVVSKYEAINRSELDDEKLLFATPAWAGESESSGAVAPVQPSMPVENKTTSGGVSNTAPAQAAAVNSVAGFREFCGKKAADGDSMAIPGNDGWLFLRTELRHISVGNFWGEDALKVSKATSPKNADPLPAILDFNEQLKALGIELILMPVPCKAFVYPEKLALATTERLDTAHQQFFKILSDKGVKVLDLADVFLKEKGKSGNPLLYCKTDSHWSPYGCEVTAKKIKEVLGTPAWLKGKPDVFTTKPETFTITGDLTDSKGSEELPVRFVKASGAALEDKNSPIILLGDSHTLVFHAGADMHGTGAGLADQLAAELGIAVDVVGARGSGATPARKNLSNRIKANPTYLDGKKVVIWCFTEREFTESTGWSLVKLGK